MGVAKYVVKMTNEETGEYRFSECVFASKKSATEYAEQWNRMCGTVASVVDSRTLDKDE